MSAAPAPISFEEYMNTSYEPDCDYVEGFLEERNVGKNKHSRTQTLLAAWLTSRERGSYKTLTEQRVQVAPRRVRIPDICLLEPKDNDEITQTPPLLWIEVLSPEDRWSRIQTRVNDALRFGVPMVWVLDPYSREAWTITRERGSVAVEDGILHCDKPLLELPLAEIWPGE